MVLHCARGRRQVPDLHGLIHLKLFSSEDVARLVHGVVDDLHGRSPNYTGVCGDVVMGKEREDMVWTLPPNAPAVFLTVYPQVQSLTSFVALAAGADGTKETIEADLKELEVPPMIAQVVSKALWGRMVELKKALASTPAHLSRCHLRDFDWTVQMVLSSDKISSLHECTVQLQLSLMDADQSKPRDVRVEMSKTELDLLLEALGNADKAVQSLHC